MEPCSLVTDCCATGLIDWGKVTPRQILELSEKMFEAAGVSREVRDMYYGELQKYIANLVNHMVARLPQGPEILVFPPTMVEPWIESIPAQEPEPLLLPTPAVDHGQDWYLEKIPVTGPIPPLFLPFPRSTYHDPGLLTFIRHFVRPIYAGAGSGGCGSCGKGPQPVTHHGIESRRFYDPTTYDPANWKDYSTGNQPSYSSSSSSSFDWTPVVIVGGAIVVVGVIAAVCIFTAGGCVVAAPALALA